MISCGADEAYQMCSMRSAPTDQWQSARWKLVRVASDYGEFVGPQQWMVEAVFADEPDTLRTVNPSLYAKFTGKDEASTLVQP